MYAKRLSAVCLVPLGYDDLRSQVGQDAEQGLSTHGECLGSVSETLSSMSAHCLSWITRLYEFYTAPVVKFWFHTVGEITVVIFLNECKIFLLLKTHLKDRLRIPPCPSCSVYFIEWIFFCFNLLSSFFLALPLF